MYLQDGATALIVSSQNGHREVVQLLIEGGANINISSNVRYLFVMWLCLVACICVCRCMCVCVCARACVRACVRVCV